MEGTYENGQIVLKHPLKAAVKTRVMVIFEVEKAEAFKSTDKRPFGISREAITMSPDFDEQLEDLEDYM